MLSSVGFLLVLPVDQVGNRQQAGHCEDSLEAGHALALSGLLLSSSLSGLLCGSSLSGLLFFSGGLSRGLSGWSLLDRGLSGYIGLSGNLSLYGAASAAAPR